MSSPDNSQPPHAVTGFWTWLVVRDEDGDRGLSNVLNSWLVAHVALALSLANLTTARPIDLAKNIALPGAAILVGLAFSWAGRSASILQDKNFSKFLIENGPRPEGFVYSFQLAILMVLLFIAVALILVAGGLGISLGSDKWDVFADRASLYLVGSIAVREAWGIIYFVNKLTIQYYRVRERELAEDVSRNGG
jgi:hypothetical protein